jgi:hypothetical protein
MRIGRRHALVDADAVLDRQPGTFGEIGVRDRADADNAGVSVNRGAVGQCDGDTLPLVADGGGGRIASNIDAAFRMGLM